MPIENKNKKQINAVWGNNNHLFWESNGTQNILSLKYTDFDS